MFLKSVSITVETISNINMFSLAIYWKVEFIKMKARLQEQNLIEFENQNSEVISMFEVQSTYLFWVESQISAHGDLESFRRTRPWYT